MKTADGLYGLFLKLLVVSTACSLFACGEDGPAETDTGSTSRCIIPCTADQVCDEVLGICVSNRDGEEDVDPGDVTEETEDTEIDTPEEDVELDEEVVEDSDPVDDPDVVENDPDVEPDPDVEVGDLDVEVSDPDVEVTDLDADQSDADSEVGDPDVTDVSDESDAGDVNEILVSKVNTMGVDLFLPEDFVITWAHTVETGTTPPSGFLVRWGDGFETQYPSDFTSTSRESGLIPGETYSFEIFAYVGENAEDRTLSEGVSETLTVPIPTGIALHPVSSVLGSYGEEPVLGEVGQSLKLTAALTYPGRDPVTIASRAEFEVVDENTHTAMAQVSSNGLVEALAPGHGHVGVSYGWDDIVLSAEAQLEVAPIYGDTGSVTVLIDTGDSNPEIEVEVFGTGKPGAESRPFDVSMTGNTPSLIDDLRPGRHHFRIEADDYVPFDVVVNLRAGEDLELNRIMLPFDSCERIEAGGGTITASDGATLTVPEYVTGAVDVCVTALPADAGPWSGPGAIADLLWPTQYHVTLNPIPDTALPLELLIPIEDDVADWIANDLSTTSLPTLWRLGGTESLGPAGEIVSGDDGSSLRVRVSQYNRTVAILACPGVGSQAGSCRVEIDACAADVQFEARPRDDDSNQTECNANARIGGQLDLGNQLVLSESSGSVGSLSDLVNPALGHTLGAWEVQVSYPFCTAYSCPAEEPECDCIAIVHEVGCGRSYSGSLAISDGTEWQTLTDFEFTVPDFGSSCGYSYESCDGGECAVQTDRPVTCSSACIWSP